MQPENDSNVKAEHSLGKGEVDSSILSGSTSKPRDLALSLPVAVTLSAVAGRTEREDDATDRGKSVDSVHEKFARAIDLAIELCLDLGMHPSDIAAVMKKRAETITIVNS